MSIRSSVMTAPDLGSDPHRDLIRMIIEARNAYEKLCGFPPFVVYVNGPIKKALAEKGFAEGGQIAGMKILSSPESIADQAICSRDEALFCFDKSPAKGEKQ